MLQIAILGYGTVGSGVLSVLKMNSKSIEQKATQAIEIKKILRQKNVIDPETDGKITHDFSDILNDNDIKIVVETMGGIDPAYDYIKACLSAEKSVVTSNKELVAAHAPELLALAKANNVNFLFEGSVGGAIPIIRPFKQSLCADKIDEIMGILNGTTNFILTKMTVENRDFDDVLKEAQQLGYAEADPTADVCGHDTCRKLAILTSLATSKHVDFKNIQTEGITNISKADIAYATKLDSVIKLVAFAKISEDETFARVSPLIVSTTHPLSMANDAFNAVFVKTNAAGELMFYGRGAGKFPTASAVVADVIDCANHLNETIPTYWSSETLNLAPIKNTICKKLIRVCFNDKDSAIATVKQIFGNVTIVTLDEFVALEFAFLTGETTEKTLDDMVAKLKTNEHIKEIKNEIRVNF